MSFLKPAITLLALVGSGHAAAMDVEVRGNGVAIRDVGNSGQSHIYPLGTRSDWENDRFLNPDEYHLFDDRPSAIVDKSYATTPIAIDYFEEDDARTDYSLDEFKSDEAGEFLIAVQSESLDAPGWTRVDDTFESTLSTFYLYSYDYTTSDEWVDIPQADGSKPTLLITDGEITWENPLPISPLAEGVIIAPGRSYIIDPNIIILDNGDYVASARGGPISDGVFVRLWRSSDKGESWSQLNMNNTGVRHPVPFEHDGDLYLLGDQSSNGLIQKSTDGGENWSDTVNLGIEFRSAPSHVIDAKGRLWVATEGEGGATVASFPAGADPMDPASWTLASHTGSGTGNEADLVETPDGGYPVIMPKGDLSTRVLSAEEANTDEAQDSLDLPGNGSKYTVQYDSVSGRWWALTSESSVPDNVRTGIALYSSSDLENFEFERQVFEGKSQKFHGFNYPFMQIDGDDIVFTLRTAWEDERGVAQRWHDANMFTFHRVRDFRSGSAPPAPEPSAPTEELSGDPAQPAPDEPAPMEPTAPTPEPAEPGAPEPIDPAEPATPEPIDPAEPTIPEPDDPAAPAPSEPASQSGNLVVRNSGKCLDVNGVSQEQTANIIQWDCNGGANQTFETVDAGDGYFQLKAAHSGQCLDVFEASEAKGANVQQWLCRSASIGEQQQFKRVDKGDGWFSLVIRHTDQCVDVKAASTSKGANVQQHPCNDGDNQQFRFE